MVLHTARGSAPHIAVFGSATVVYLWHALVSESRVMLSHLNVRGGSAIGVICESAF